MDNRLSEYHRNNGVYKIKYKTKDGYVRLDIITEAQIGLVDLMSTAYDILLK